MSRFVSTKTEEELTNSGAGVSKQMKAGTCELMTIEKAVFKANGNGWMELYAQGAEEMEGLDNPTQPLGNAKYQYCKTSFSMSDKALGVDGNLSLINFLATIATVLGEREAWDDAAAGATTNEDFAEAITDFFAGKEFVGALQGEIKTINTGDGDITFTESFLSKGSFIAANKDNQDTIDSLVAMVEKAVADTTRKYPWIKDSRVAIEDTDTTETPAPTTGW